MEDHYLNRYITYRWSILHSYFKLPEGNQRVSIAGENSWSLRDRKHIIPVASTKPFIHEDSLSSNLVHGHTELFKIAHTVIDLPVVII